MKNYHTKWKVFLPKEMTQRYKVTRKRIITQDLLIKKTKEQLGIEGVLLIRELLTKMNWMNG